LSENNRGFKICVAGGRNWNKIKILPTGEESRNKIGNDRSLKKSVAHSGNGLTVTEAYVKSGNR
jgi:hypothetical protein